VPSVVFTTWQGAGRYPLHTPNQSLSDGDHVAPAITQANLVQAARANNILAGLPANEMNQLAAKLKPVPLIFGEVLYRPEEPIDYVYFVTAGIVSLLAVLEDGSTVEAGLIGAEGMLGIPVVLGATETPNQALVQGKGHALRMSAPDLKSALSNGSSLLERSLRYMNYLFLQVAQTAACNRTHHVNQRLACWLLLIHDRMPGNEFSLTQDLMSRMLGVRRAGVSVAAATLRQAGLVDYQRAKMTISNRRGLEEAACECYRTVKNQFDRLFIE